MTDMDSVFAGLASEADKKFGKGKIIAIDALNATMCGVPCPIAWAYTNGGSDVVPCGRVLGGDGPPGYFKSSISMEHARWFLLAGGYVVLVDSEEKTSDTMTRSLLWDMEPEVRKRFRYVKAGSIDEAQKLVNFFKDKAKDFRRSLKPAQQFPILVIWDSLTGNATEGQQAKIEKEGSAATRAFPEQALQISNFYKSYTVDDAFVTLMHVQHAKKSTDPNAVGDDEFVPNGGLEPKYKATYHYRMTSVKAVESQDWSGKEVRMKMIKSGLGENGRKLQFRVLWRSVWVDVPQVEEKGGKYKVIPDPTGTKITMDQAVVLYEQAKQALDPEHCDALLLYMKLDAKDPPEFIIRPLTERKRLQQTWFDWGWALANLLVEMKYGEVFYIAEKKALGELLDFTKGDTKDLVKSKEVFGDNEEHSYTDFGNAIEKSPEISLKLKAFLGITHYQSPGEYAAVNEAHPAKKKAEKVDK